MNIIELAKQAGMPIDDDSFIFQATRERVTRFAALVRAAALAEPQQEPVAWMCSNTELIHKGYQRFSATKGGDWNIPVYTKPHPIKQPLTDEEIEGMARGKSGHNDFARTIERAHGITGETK